MEIYLGFRCIYFGKIYYSGKMEDASCSAVSDIHPNAIPTFRREKYSPDAEMSFL